MADRFEMLWDCGQCGTKALLGLTHRHCPTCGAAQDPARRYYPPAGSEVAVASHPYQGADRICGACDTPNAAASTFCVACGASLDEAKSVATRGAQHAVGSAFAADDASAAAGEHAARKAEAEAKRSAAFAKAAGVRSPSQPTSSGRWPVAALVSVLVVVCCGGLGAALFWRHDEALTVTGHTWERRIGIERFELVAGSAWRDQVPTGAQDLSCHTEQHGTREVPDGQDCHDVRVDQGDGTFSVSTECTPRTRSEPVDDIKCSYRITMWHEVDAVERKGSDLLPVWPVAEVSQPGSCLGCGREGARTEQNLVSLVGADGAEFVCDLPTDRWAAMADGSLWTGSVGVVTGKLDCDGLHAP